MNTDSFVGLEQRYVEQSQKTGIDSMKQLRQDCETSRESCPECEKATKAFQALIKTDNMTIFVVDSQHYTIVPHQHRTYLDITAIQRTKQDNNFSLTCLYYQNIIDDVFKQLFGPFRSQLEAYVPHQHFQYLITHCSESSTSVMTTPSENELKELRDKIQCELIKHSQINKLYIKNTQPSDIVVELLNEPQNIDDVKQLVPVLKKLLEDLADSTKSQETINKLARYYPKFLNPDLPEKTDWKGILEKKIQFFEMSEPIPNATQKLGLG